MKRRARETLERLRSDVDPGALTTELSGGQRQTVAVARALLFDRDIVMMDEPTAAVSVNRAQDVLSLITDLKDHGKTVLLISHRLDDVLAVCNRVAVFVAGSLAELVPNVELQVPDLIHMMFGSPLADNGRL
jgi:simple sugar transport system ATP-binding protein